LEDLIWDSEGGAVQIDRIERENDLIPGTFSGECRWYAIHTYSQNEKKVASELENRSFESFVPFRTEIHQWSDRKKAVPVPLFPCYAFVRMAATAHNCSLVTRIPRVLRLLGADNGRPTPLPDSEIESTRRLAAGGVPLSPYAYLRIGQKVRIRGGALDGVQGIVVGNDKDCVLVVSVNLIQQSVALSLRGYRVEPI
jgi:transcription antitermination factor NusG